MASFPLGGGRNHLWLTCHYSVMASVTFSSLGSSSSLDSMMPRPGLRRGSFGDTSRPRCVSGREAAITDYLSASDEGQLEEPSVCELLCAEEEEGCVSSL